MRKKGQAEVLQTILLFELIAGMLIAGILFYAVTNINETSRFNKKYVQQDYELTIGIVESMPGDLELSYPTGRIYIEDGKFRELGILSTDRFSLKIIKGDRGITSETIQQKDEKSSL